MNPSVKKHIIRTRVVLLILRCLQILGAAGALAVMILLKDVNATTVWLMRIPPGLAMLHALYAIIHLSRKPAKRTPGSSASYMIFASALDFAILPFYIYGGLEAGEQYELALRGIGQSGEWSSLLSQGQTLVPVLSGTAFLCYIISGGLLVISIGLSVYLAVTFRKITKLPPDMNPLEDNLTSRHKRNKSELTVSTDFSEKRLSTPMEHIRHSGVPYEDLSRPPTIPFMHTRSNSTDSFVSFQTKDSKTDLPKRQYQIHTKTDSAGSSVTELKNSSLYRAQSPSKTGSHTALLSEPDARQLTPKKEAWFNSEELSGPASNTRARASQSPTRSSPRHHAYKPLHQRHESTDDVPATPLPFSSSYPDLRKQARSPAQTKPKSSTPAPAIQPARTLPNPFTTAPPQNFSRKPNKLPSAYTAPALSELSTSTANIRKSSSNYSDDVADADRYDAPSPEPHEYPLSSGTVKRYGDLRPASPLRASERQVSSGTDLGMPDGGAAIGLGLFGRRDVSGKIAEEGRGGGSWSGARYRKVSGL